MATAFAVPKVSGTPLQSDISSLMPPADSSATRRLSDSALRSRQDMVALEKDGELAKLRRWAAEVMTSRPKSINEASLSAVEDDYSPMFRRGSEHLNRPFHDTMPHFRSAYKRSTSPGSRCSNSNWSDFLVDGFEARPKSFFAIPPSSELTSSGGSGSSDVTAVQSGSVGIRRSSANNRKRPALQKAVNMASPSACLLSAHDSTPKSRTNELSRPSVARSNVPPSETTPLREKRSQAVRDLRLPFPAPTSLLMTPDEKTPRAKSSLVGLSSPTWTSSTCGSEEDSLNLMTPSDELEPHPPRGVTSSLRSQRNNLAERVSEESEMLSSPDRAATAMMQGMKLSSMLDSRTSTISESKEEQAPPSGTLPSSQETQSQQSPSLATAPLFHHSTLLDIGSVNGITPPAARHSAGYGPACSGSSVVTAGLELGLGLTRSDLAVAATLPDRVSSSNGAIQPRVSMPAAPTRNNFVSHSAAHVQRADVGELQLQSSPAPSYYGSDSRCSLVKEDASHADSAREDAELARRRTTGGLASSTRRDHSIGIRRHIRADTHDPTQSSATTATSNGALHAGNSAFASTRGTHRLTNSISTFPSLPETEADATGRYDSKLRDYRHFESRAPLSAGASSWSISDAIAFGSHSSTPLGTPRESHAALFSPDLSSTATTDYCQSYIQAQAGQEEDRREGRSSAVRGGNEENRKANHLVGPTAFVAGGLMGMGGGGHFGPGVRAKIGEALHQLIERVPMSNGADGQTIQLVEYGCLNSRSAQLMQPIISLFAGREAKKRNVQEDSNSRTALTFQVTHEDSTMADFRPLMLHLDSHLESYMDTHWQSTHTPSLSNSVFSSFVARPFASRVVSPQTFHAGFSLMDLHWTHTPVDPSISSVVAAQAELAAFLRARAQEFKQGGVLILAYIARSEEGGSSGGLRKDLWTTLSNTLAPCIQRLVSCGMLKSDVARQLLSLPLHPRSAIQTKAALSSVASTWKLEWSCGLGEECQSQDMEAQSSIASEPHPLRLPHPAWKAYNSGTLSRVPFTEHMIQLFKNLYESHFRAVLRERGNLSKGAAEFVLDSLWDVLFSRIVDQNPSPMKDVEVEVNIVALRRR